MKTIFWGCVLVLVIGLGFYFAANQAPGLLKSRNQAKGPGLRMTRRSRKRGLGPKMRKRNLEKCLPHPKPQDQPSRRKTGREQKSPNLRKPKPPVL